MPSGLQVIKKTDRLGQLIKQGNFVANRITELRVKEGVDYLVSIMPERTGEMKRQTKAVQFSQAQVKPGWGIKIGVPYWRYVNDGTIYIEGQHFVERAIERIRAAIDSDCRQFEAFLR